jgi:chemosensory pili system protein ChpA (sensor histidine kinase/response regulator)
MPPAMVAEEMEQLAQALQAGREPIADEACATLMRGCRAAARYYLEATVRGGTRTFPIVLAAAAESRNCGGAGRDRTR